MQMGVNVTEKTRKIREQAVIIVSEMSIEEQASMCSGKDMWYLKSIEKYGLEEIMVSDGPSGVRQQTAEGDNLGIGDSIPAVCFPSGSTTACSFDRDLIYRIGKAMGEECVSQGVSVLLGPAANQKRSPLCGRNFEYFSEDPYATGELAAWMIRGIQSTGTGTSLKHYAVNNQERHRMTVSAVIDERALYETYLRGFEIAVRKGKPDTVMCCYNKINGVYGSENEQLLNGILRDKWGFEGVVMSDWGAVHDRVLGVKSGLDLEMPGNDGYNDKKIVQAVKDGILSKESVAKAATNVVALILKSMENKKSKMEYDVKFHHDLAVKAAVESAVLLKNVGQLLPVSKEKKIAIIGQFAKKPRYQGAGSSRMHPIQVDDAWSSILEYSSNVYYAPGYRENIQPNDILSAKKQQEATQLLEEAVTLAKSCDIVFVFAGLTEGYESEGFDRSNMMMPHEHNLLIEKICAANRQTAVILAGGAPIELPWEEKVPAILCAYLGGEGGGQAIAGLLFGEYVPSGKLAETWPIKIDDNPSFRYFPGGRDFVEYRESIYVGYKYYEKAKKNVRYPFGHGLSYSTFAYSNIVIDDSKYEQDKQLIVRFSLTNLGIYKAKETSFVFFHHLNEHVFMPEKQLCGFTKTELEAGETKQVELVVEESDMAYYNVLLNDWYVDLGSYELLVGSSSEKCELKVEVTLSGQESPQPNTLYAQPEYRTLHDSIFEVSDLEFERLCGHQLQKEKTEHKRPYTEENTLEDIQGTFVGKIIGLYASKIVRDATKGQDAQAGMMEAMIWEMPFYSMVASGDGMLSESMMYGILDLLNGHPFKGIKKILS